MTIRQAQLEDMTAIMELIGQSDMSPDNALSEKEAATLFSTITSTPFHRLYVVEEESSIFGTFALITVQQLSHNGARSIVIEDIVVRSDMQGKGIGQSIMKFAAEEA